MGEKDDKLICGKCNVPLEEREVTFEYMNLHFNHTLPRCPACGQTYVSEHLAKDKVKQVEMMLETK